MSFAFITNEQMGKEKKEQKLIVNKKISEILVNLVNESLRKKERQLYYSKLYYDDPRKPHEILKEELSKPIVISRKELMHFPEESRRDIQVKKNYIQ